MTTMATRVDLQRPALGYRRGHVDQKEEMPPRFLNSPHCCENISGVFSKSHSRGTQISQ